MAGFARRASRASISNSKGKPQSFSTHRSGTNVRFKWGFLRKISKSCINCIEKSRTALSIKTLQNVLSTKIRLV